MKDKFVKPCRLIKTKDRFNRKNGWLLEIDSVRDRFTEKILGQVYLTTATPGAVKGFHIHQKKIDHFTCIRGNIKLVVFDGREYRAYPMGERNFITVKVPPRVPHAIYNCGRKEAYIINYCWPAFDPKDPDEVLWEGDYDFKKGKRYAKR